MNRTERRQLERRLGKHRAEGKKGRRKPWRVPAQGQVVDPYPLLRAAGFKKVQRKLPKTLR